MRAVQEVGRRAAAAALVVGPRTAGHVRAPARRPRRSRRGRALSAEVPPPPPRPPLQSACDASRPGGEGSGRSSARVVWAPRALATAGRRVGAARDCRRSTWRARYHHDHGPARRRAPAASRVRCAPSSPNAHSRGWWHAPGSTPSARCSAPWCSGRRS